MLVGFSALNPLFNCFRQQFYQLALLYYVLDAFSFEVISLIGLQVAGNKLR
jgi:hypothetical protein